MNSMELVRFPTRAARPPQGPKKKSLPPFCAELVGPVRNAIVRARHLLVTQQRSDGSWLGRQSGDVSLSSQLIFLLTYLGRDDSELSHQCAATILNEQRPDGGWSVHPDGAADVSMSVQSYFALKLAGHDPTDERMVAAREQIRALGGADASDGCARFFLALLGQVNHAFCEPAPPVRAVAMERGIRELFINKPCNWPEISAGTPEVNHGESQVVEAIEPDRISELSFHELARRIVALRTSGHLADSPELSICEEALEQLVDVDDASSSACPRFRNGARADSALAIRSLLESGMSSDHPAVVEGLEVLSPSSAAASSLSTSEIGNIAESLRRYEMAESENGSALPPDIDVRWDWHYTPASVEQMADEGSEIVESTAASYTAELLSSQNFDGGWSDVNASRQQAQSSEPVATSAALEFLAASADELSQVALRRGGDFLRSQQLADGRWENFDGTQQIGCTSVAIRGLLAAGAAIDDDCIAAAMNWLVVQQQPTGGWNDSSLQTAWAVLGLVAAGRVDHPAIRRGIQFLLDAQGDDGGWIDRQAALRNAETGHWFRNDLHSACWPLLALSRFAVAASSAQPLGTPENSLRLAAVSADN